MPIRKDKMNRSRRKAKKVTPEERFASVLKQRIAIGAVLAVLLLYTAVSLYYVGHFEKNSKINGIDVSGLNLKKAKALI